MANLNQIAIESDKAEVVNESDITWIDHLKDYYKITEEDGKTVKV